MGSCDSWMDGGTERKMRGGGDSTKYLTNKPTSRGPDSGNRNW